MESNIFFFIFLAAGSLFEHIHAKGSNFETLGDCPWYNKENVKLLICYYCAVLNFMTTKIGGKFQTLNFLGRNKGKEISIFNNY